MGLPLNIVLDVQKLQTRKLSLFSKCGRVLSVCLFAFYFQHSSVHLQHPPFRRDDILKGGSVL